MSNIRSEFAASGEYFFVAFFDNIFNRNQFEYMQLCVFNLDNLKHITLSDQILTLLSPKQKNSIGLSSTSHISSFRRHVCVKYWDQIKQCGLKMENAFTKTLQRPSSVPWRDRKGTLSAGIRFKLSSRQLTKASNSRTLKSRCQAWARF